MLWKTESSVGTQFSNQGVRAMRVALGQFGGPTPVLNASLAGALSACAAAGLEAWGVFGGPRGLAEGDLRRLAAGDPGVGGPGAVLGAGRSAWGRGERERALAALRAHDIEGLLLIGGNGTMGLGQDLAAAAPWLSVIGVPKTIDNDLAGTDRAPGYRSAATFTARACAALEADLRAMAGFEDVRLVEVMGRRAGWLAGAAVAGAAQALVLLPEVPVNLDGFRAEVAERHRRGGPVLVVVAEGVREAGGAELGAMATDAGGSRRVYGQAAQVLAAALRRDLGLAVRAESLGFLPRCFLATDADRGEAAGVGRRGAELLASGRSGLMVGIERDGTLSTVPLAAAAARERPLPRAYQDLGAAWRNWLLPLLEPTPPTGASP